MSICDHETSPKEKALKSTIVSHSHVGSGERGRKYVSIREEGEE